MASSIRQRLLWIARCDSSDPVFAHLCSQGERRQTHLCIMKASFVCKQKDFLMSVINIFQTIIIFHGDHTGPPRPPLYYGCRALRISQFLEAL